MRAVFRPFERVEEAHKIVGRDVDDPEYIDALTTLAMAAAERGDDAEYERLSDEIERRIASGRFAIETANRYVDDFIKLAEKEGMDMAAIKDGARPAVASAPKKPNVVTRDRERSAKRPRGTPRAARARGGVPEN